MKKILILLFSLMLTGCSPAKPVVGQCYIYDGHTFVASKVGEQSVVIERKLKDKKVLTITMALRTFYNLRSWEMMNQVDCWE